MHPARLQNATKLKRSGSAGSRRGATITFHISAGVLICPDVIIISVVIEAGAGRGVVPTTGETLSLILILILILKNWRLFTRTRAMLTAMVLAIAFLNLAAPLDFLIVAAGIPFFLIAGIALIVLFDFPLIRVLFGTGLSRGLSAHFFGLDLDLDLCGVDFDRVLGWKISQSPYQTSARVGGAAHPTRRAFLRIPTHQALYFAPLTSVLLLAAERKADVGLLGEVQADFTTRLESSTTSARHTDHQRVQLRMVHAVAR